MRTTSVSRMRLPLAVPAAVMAASLLDLVIAGLAHAAGASRDFTPREPQALVFLTAVGMLAATAGWALVRRSWHAAATLRWLVPVVLVLSFVPDVAVGTSRTQTGTTWTGVVGLMVMHLSVAALALVMLSREQPVGGAEDVVPAG